MLVLCAVFYHCRIQLLCADYLRPISAKNLGKYTSFGVDIWYKAASGDEGRLEESDGNSRGLRLAHRVA